MTATVSVGATSHTTRRPRLRRPGRTVLALTPAVVVILLAVFGHLLGPYSSTDVVAHPDLAPSSHHWFGTDSNGMDVLSRTLAGFAYDVAIGAGVAVLSGVVGIAAGIALGMYEGRGNLLGVLMRLLSRGLDLLQAVPAVVLSLAIVSFFGASVTVMLVSVSIVLFPSQARVVRSEALRVRQEGYVEAARIAGYPERRLVIKHVLPNASWPALEAVPLVFGSAIFVVAALGFLGIGLPTPTPEWGSMIAIGAPAAAVGRWWAATFPSVALALTVIAFAIAGHALLRTRSGQR
jgi:peptide/nickel transport system permease protein